MCLTVSGGYVVAGGLEHQSTHRGENHAQENNRRRVVCNEIVTVTNAGLACTDSDTRSAQAKQYKGVNGQDDESGKNQNMHDTRSSITRMLPLRKPELQDTAQSVGRAIETKILFGLHKRSQTFRHNIGKAAKPQNVHGPKQRAAGNEPIGRLRRRWDGFQHNQATPLRRNSWRSDART